MTAVFPEYGAPEEGELKKQKPLPLTKNLISESRPFLLFSVWLADMVLIWSFFFLFLTALYFISTWPEITFVFPDHPDRQPIQKKLSGKCNRHHHWNHSGAEFKCLSFVFPPCSFHGAAEGEGPPAPPAEGSCRGPEAHLQQPKGETSGPSLQTSREQHF